MSDKTVNDYQGPVEHSIEIAVEHLEKILDEGYPISARSISVMLLQEDEEILKMVARRQPDDMDSIKEIIDKVKSYYGHPVEYEIALRRKDEAVRLASRTVTVKEKKIPFREKLSRVMMNPLTGIPLLIAVLYLGLYKFVGEFGAGTVVDFIEGTIFEEKINPVLTAIISKVIPWEVFRELFVGEYGVLTLGFRYAVALILPIVTFFFVVFSIIEDSGYLPRIALLIDRVFKKIGLSGRAVIPMVLGLGCATMATMVTRTLPTKRERVISTILLSLAVPCSAQLGVIFALLAGKPLVTLTWLGVVVFVFLLIGYLSSLLMPGEKPSFYMEVPPLRIPRISNVALKTYVRVKWYFKEVLPLFIIASFFIWLGQLIGLFGILIRGLEYPVRMIGLPDEAAKIFLFGFFRRDYGAAGLYDLDKLGLLNGNQLAVACIALTLFLPCIAQFLMNLKERGWKTGVGISFFILIFSFGMAYIVNLALNLLGIML